MHITLKMVEKMDRLLEETEDYIKCANMHSDDQQLKKIYLDLARCHFDGFENLEQYCVKAAEQKAAQNPDHKILQEMVGWHKDRFDEKAATIKHKLDNAR